MLKHVQKRMWQSVELELADPKMVTETKEQTYH